MKNRERRYWLIAGFAVGILLIIVIGYLVKFFGVIASDPKLIKWLNMPISELKIGHLILAVFLIYFFFKY